VAEPFKVGILGTGRMARELATSLAALDDVRLHAVGSRDEGRAKAFAADFDAPAHYGDYAALANDPDVDLVYVSTPHARHLDDSLLCVEAGKAVLCEKPLTINAREALTLIDAAQDRGTFLMEALWSRFLPAYHKLGELLAAGTIGEVQLMIAGGAFTPDYQPGFYLFDRELGGGVLLDAGVYLVSAASLVFGMPSEVHATGNIGRYGVDEQDAILLQHEGGGSALLYVSLTTRQSPALELLGTAGRIHLDAPIFAPGGLTLELFGEAPQHIRLPYAGNGYHYQVAAAARAIRNGATECDAMPLAESLAILHTMDAIREQTGMRYAADD